MNRKKRNARGGIMQKVNEQTEKAERNACDEVATNGTVVRSKGHPLGPVLAQL